MSLLNPLFESWLFQAAQEEIPSWKKALLRRALREDAALRSVALALADFMAGASPLDEACPDFRGAVRLRIADSEAPKTERPLFPSAWVPAGAIAVLVVTAIVALSIQSPEPQKSVPTQASVRESAVGQTVAPGDAKASALAADASMPTTHTAAQMLTATPSSLVGPASK
jgi:hypothetical protein